MNEQQRLKGRVKFFNEKKGYGFVTSDQGKDYFVHYTSINVKGFKTLGPDQKVSFRPGDTQKGVAAFEVTPERE